MNERAIVDRLKQRAGTLPPALVLGIGDDCAIYRPQPGEELLFTTDFVIEGVHFRAGDPPERVGRKALARALSDIAAMAGEPRFCLLSLAAPSDEYVERFYDGLLPLAAQTGAALAGGDLSRAEHPFCDVIVCGAAPTGGSIRRGGAQPGDLLYVSGPLGRAASRGYEDEFTPRLDLAGALRGRATACMDLSDGFAIDLHRLCDASGVGAEVAEVPGFAGASVEQTLFGGEDYELLFTAPPGVEVPGIAVGTIQHERITWRGSDLPARGWDHFG